MSALDSITYPNNDSRHQYLDLDTWNRRSAFDYFRGFDIPTFNLCARLDVSLLKQAVKDLRIGSLSLAYHFIAIRLANDIAPFRYRLEGERVRVHAAVHGATTVLRDDDSFGFATLEHNRDFAAFCVQGGQALARGRLVTTAFEPNQHGTATVHMTTLPWVHFSSFSHARKWGPHDSIPKISFGRIDSDGARHWMPLSVDVHHALMDGLHVGRFFEGFEAALQHPEVWLQPAKN
jgi:chloramphenicol O-acetyltransferase type A